MKAQTFFSSLISSSVWGVLQKIIALLKHILLAGLMGLSLHLDVFYASMSIFGLLVFSGSNILQKSILPELSVLWKTQTLDTFNRLVKSTFCMCLILGAVVSVLIYLFAPLLSKIPAGFSDEKSALLTQGMIWLLPIALLSPAYNFIVCILISARQFSSYYQSQFLQNVFILLIIVLFPNANNVLFWSLSIGFLLSYVFLIWRAKSIAKLTPVWPKLHESRSLFQKSKSLFLPQALLHIYILTDYWFASLLQHGAISALAYGSALTLMLRSIIRVESSFVAILAAQDRHQEQQNRINDFISLSIYMSVLVMVCLFLFSDVLIKFLFERGAFTQTHSAYLTQAILGYLGILLPHFITTLAEQVLQVTKQISWMTKPMIIGIISNILLNSLFLFVFKAGITGVALSTSISYTLMALASLSLLSKASYRIEWKRHLYWMLWLFLIMGSWALLIKHNIQNTGTFFYLVTYMAITLLLWCLAGLLHKGKEGQLVRKYANHNVIKRRLNK